MTLGCAKNQVDTDNLERLLNARGYEVVNDPASAGAIVVHTCSFIEAAKKESIEAILQAGQMKSAGQQLIVTGCLVQQHGKEIFDEMPEVDAFLGTGQLAQVPDVLNKPRKRFLDRANPGGFMDPDIPPSSPVPPWRGSSTHALDSGLRTRRVRTRPISGREGVRRNEVTAYLRLSEGCSHPCSFCVIPRLRGPVQSRRKETILREARALARQGVQEFVVIAQDTGAWNDGKGLPELLRTIAKIPNVRWVRLMYMHPVSFTDPMLEVLAEQPKKFPYLDMPLQHIDSKVLSEMRRKMDEPSLRRLIETIRKRAPALTLRTTFIVGFPGETDREFARLLDFVKEGHFDYLGAFAYSKEEGTPAARRTDQIPDDVKQDRLTALTNAYYDVAHAKAMKRIGTMETVLLEETEGSDVLGRTCREAPEIDAVVRLSGKAARAGRQGRFIRAKLTTYDAYEFSAD